MKKNLIALYLSVAFGFSCYSQSQSYELASCPNGIQVTLKSNLEGNYTNTRNESGYYYSYILELRNRTAQEQSHSSIYFHFNGLEPINFGCFEDPVVKKSGSSTTINGGSGSLKPYEVRKRDFIFIFSSQHGNVQLVKEAEFYAKNLCSGNFSTQATSKCSTYQ